MPDMWSDALAFANYCGEGPTDEPPEPDADDQRFVVCLWRCGTCRTDGKMRVWSYRGETPNDTAERQERQTRSACRRDCGFSVTPVSSAPQGDGDDGQWETGA